jgi:hypothetical protein
MARNFSPTTRFRFLALLICLLCRAAIACAQQCSANVTIGKNANAVALGLYGQVLPHYIIGVNILDVTWVADDPYNPGARSTSYLTLIGTGVFVATVIVAGVTSVEMSSCGPKPSPAWKWVLLPMAAGIALINSEHHYVFYDGGGDNQLSLSMFLKTKFDYYGQHDVSWARWAPGGGLGMIGRFKSPTLIQLVRADLGVDKPIDLVHRGVVTSDWRPMVTLGVCFN